MMTHTSLVPVVFIAICFAVRACADPVSVKSADELIRLFEEAGGNTLKTDIEVSADLDFPSSTLTLPLGVLPNGTCVAFSD